MFGALIGRRVIALFRYLTESAAERKAREERELEEQRALQARRINLVRPRRIWHCLWIGFGIGAGATVMVAPPVMIMGWITKILIMVGFL